MRAGASGEPPLSAALLLQTVVLTLCLSTVAAHADGDAQSTRHRHGSHHHHGRNEHVKRVHHRHHSHARSLRSDQASVPLENGFAGDDPAQLGSQRFTWRVSSVPGYEPEPSADAPDGLVGVAADGDDAGSVQFMRVQAGASRRMGVRPPDGDMDKYCGRKGSSSGPVAPEDLFEVGETVAGNYRGKGFWYNGVIDALNREDDTYNIKYNDGRIEYGVSIKRIRATDGYKVNDWVEAQWKGYSRWYMAQVTGVNSDGTYTVRYKDDGVIETGVKLKNLRTAKGMPAPKIDTTKDAICEMKETVEELKREMKAADGDVRSFREKGDAASASSKIAAVGPPRFSTDVLGGAPAPAAAWAPSPAPAWSAAPSPMSAIDKAALEATNLHIDNLRKEIAARTGEIVERMAALGAMDWEMEELHDLLAQDIARLSRPFPGTPAEALAEAERLKKVIMDRARRLQELLDKEKEVVEEAKPEPPTYIDVQKVVEKVQEREHRIQELQHKLEEKRQKLVDEGRLDPELEASTKQLASSVDKTVHQMAAAQAVVGEPPIVAQKKLKDLERDMEESMGEADNFGLEVLPHGKKWWRYRWEYSFVEALIICLLCLLAAFWHMVHDFLRARLTDHVLDTPVFIEDLLPHVALATWLRYFLGEMVVMLLTVISLWMLSMFGIWEFWVAKQFSFMESYNLPTEPVMYEDISFNVAMQLVIALMLFYLLTLQICYQALRNDRDCRNLEESRIEEIRLFPITLSMIGKFARSPEEYAALKKGWLEGVTQRSSELTPREARGQAKQVCDVLNERGVLADGNHNAFPLWYFISQRVRKGVEKTFMLNAYIWLAFFLTFFGFALLHSLAQIAYIRISIALSMVSIACFAYMMFSIRDMRSVHDNTMVIRMKPMVVVCCFQFPLFFLCFVATRLVVSAWMWVFFFQLTLFITCMVVAFLFFFPIVIAPLLITYLIKTSFPPHTNDSVGLIRAAMNEREITKMREELRYKAPRVFGSPPMTNRLWL